MNPIVEFKYRGAVLGVAHVGYPVSYYKYKKGVIYTWYGDLSWIWSSMRMHTLRDYYLANMDQDSPTKKLSIEVIPPEEWDKMEVEFMLIHGATL